MVIKVSSNATSQVGQAQHTKAWANEHKKVERVVGNKVATRKKDSFGIWLDRVGKKLVVLAIIFGLATVWAQINILLG